MIKRPLFLAVLAVSALSTQSSFAAESTATSAKPQVKAQTKLPAKVDVPKPQVSVDAKTPPAAKPAPLDKTAKDAGNKNAAIKEANVKTAATVKSTSEKATDKNPKTVKHAPTTTLVPPPPPETPTIFGGMPEGDFDSLASLEYMSLTAMKERQKQLNVQLLDAKEELKTRQADAEEVKGKASQFENLYTEGVISKHELEVTKREAGEVDAKISRAKMRVDDLQSNIGRLTDHIKNQEQRVARVKKNSTNAKNKIAIIKKSMPKTTEKNGDKTSVKADKPPVKEEKAAEKADKPAAASTAEKPKTSQTQAPAPAAKPEEPVRKKSSTAVDSL